MLAGSRARIAHILSGAECCAIPVVLAACLFWTGPIGVINAPVETARAQTVGANRVVTIGGSITEIVYALGLQNRIVGLDTTSVYPTEALKNAPNVGYMRALSAEGILSLKPRSVIVIDGSGPPAALKLVTDAGVPLTYVHDEPSADGVAQKIEAVGRLLGESDRAAKLADETRARFTLIDAMRAKIVKPARVLFVLSLQNGRPMVGGHGSAADAIIKLAGAVNAAEGIEGYKPMTDEAVIAAAPDAILKMTNGNLVGAADEMFALPSFAATPAATKKTLIGMDGLYLLGFGPRTPDAARDLMTALYPDLALPPLPKATAWR
ncbi:hemin ABC transporter substrate-binding protein [Methylocapsa sp. S129]|uniref:heme/hemin ABC transporter substrate-binding protein n=1 Tax=Methylocapsa sp. S129 TaxID=1641869 RepID=UPI00131DE05C|nr:ABC transporter substrate-binding protein [Methylocapsa sp. S129]